MRALESFSDEDFRRTIPAGDAPAGSHFGGRSAPALVEAGLAECRASGGRGRYLRLRPLGAVAAHDGGDGEVMTRVYGAADGDGSAGDSL